jgi:hypothetical protein
MPFRASNKWTPSQERLVERYESDATLKAKDDGIRGKAALMEKIRHLRDGWPSELLDVLNADMEDMRAAFDALARRLDDPVRQTYPPGLGITPVRKLQAELPLHVAAMTARAIVLHPSWSEARRRSLVSSIAATVDEFRRDIESAMIRITRAGRR